MVPFDSRLLILLFISSLSSRAIAAPTIHPRAESGLSAGSGSDASTDGEAASPGPSSSSSSSTSSSFVSFGGHSTNSGGTSHSAAFTSSRSQSMLSTQFTASLNPATSPQTITSAVLSIGKNDAVGQQTLLLDRPAVQSTSTFAFTPYPNSDPSIQPSAYFQPLNSSVAVCLATTSDVLCLPSGTYPLGYSSVLQPRTRNFSVADVQFLIMPPGASLILHGSSNPKKVKDSYPYTQNVTGRGSGVFRRDILSRLLDPKISSSQAVVQKRDKEDVSVSKIQDGAAFVVDVPSGLEPPCACAWTNSAYMGDFYCFGKGEASIAQAGGTPVFSTQSVQFHGGASMMGVYAGKGFDINADTNDLDAYIGAGGKGATTSFKVF